MELKKNLALKLIESAYNEVPYYNNRYNELEFDFLDLDHFEQLPIVSKEEIKKYGIVNFVSMPYVYQIKEGADKNSYRMEFTSGTTSEPIEILWDNTEYFASVRHHWNERRKFNILTDSRVLRAKEFKTKDGKVPYSIEDNILYYNLKINQEQDFLVLIKKINEFQPEWICMTASRIYLLLRIAKQYQIPLFQSVRFIEYIGEPVLPHYKQYIERTVNIPTTNMYGCTETNGIAYTCEHGNFHVLSQNVYVEIMDHQVKQGFNQVGNICVTGYYNTKSPFIRYRLNDRGMLRSHSECPCGNKNDILQLFLTRLPSVFIMDDDSIYDGIRIYYEIFSLPNLWQGQEYGYFLLKLISKEGLDTYRVTFEKKERQAFSHKLEQHFANCIKSYGLPHLQLVFDYVDAIDPYQRNCGVFIIKKD